jgi:hypothetical protein
VLGVGSVWGFGDWRLVGDGEELRKSTLLRFDAAACFSFQPLLVEPTDAESNDQVRQLPCFSQFQSEHQR